MEKEIKPKVFNCTECNTKFETRQKLDQHRNNHLSNAHCDTCPIDMAIGKLAKLFRRSGKTF